MDNEDDGYQENMHEYIIGFKFFHKSALQIFFYEDGNAFPLSGGRFRHSAAVPSVPQELRRSLSSFL